MTAWSKCNCGTLLPSQLIHSHICQVGGAEVASTAPIIEEMIRRIVREEIDRYVKEALTFKEKP